MSAQETIVAAINAKFTTPPVLTLKQAKSASRDYINVFTSRRYVADRRVSGEVTMPGSRVIVRCVCKTEANLDAFRARVTAALEDQILAGDIGPFVFETEDLIDPDEADGTDWFMSESAWTF